MESNNTSENDHLARSIFVQGLVQRSHELNKASPVLLRRPPKKIVQFWNDLSQLPGDVRECIESWRRMETQGFELLLFDEKKAREFIHRELGSRHEKAFDKCYHPAMQSDYFRLCYILVKGGCYVDADDVYQGQTIEHLFYDGRLKIQPLCYDMLTDKMVPPSTFTKAGANNLNWIVYFNNNPLLAASGHPIIEWALTQATSSLDRYVTEELPDIQSTTGPGNLTKSIFNFLTKNGGTGENLFILRDWEDIAISRWPLSYRNDSRNWRLSDCKDYNQHQQEQMTSGDT